MSPGPLLLEGAVVLTLDDDATAGRLSVAVEEGLIAAVGEPARLRHRFRRAQRVDCSGRVLLPGLVNAHLHPELHVLKGAVEELRLHDWEDAEHFVAALAVLSSPGADWIQRAGIRAALADCLLTGTTCVATYGITTGADRNCAAELAALGLRGHVTIRDITFEPAAPMSPPEAPFFIGRIYRLHAEETLTVGELEAAARAHARGERIVMHAAETEYRVEALRESFGTSTIRLLDRYGLLSPRTLLSHALYVDDAERRLLAARGAPVISSPTAEMKLSDGTAPIRSYLSEGIVVALGTDCALCNNSNDMFLEMRQLGLVQKLRYGADAVPAEQILRIATREGARALEDQARYGALREGWSADLILVDTANPRLQPLVHRDRFSNVAANLVYAATGQDVTDVMIGGQWRVRSRRLVDVDGSAIWEGLASAAAALYDQIL